MTLNKFQIQRKINQKISNDFIHWEAITVLKVKTIQTKIFYKMV